MPKAEKPKGGNRKVPFQRAGLEEEIDEESRVPVKQTKKAPKRRDDDAQVPRLAVTGRPCAGPTRLPERARRRYPVARDVLP
jgi:hypothetical protein